ncbi:MAG: helix-hairpin-helix domain-containing protein [Acidimicrobiia bacterium]|nr:helix-hairpin-helix domain-containing protein [Acidimicrobiia bacterium]MDH5292420.1 helix-hairpin-helix domain-containing protein [Acidimicrobiia bacterium]
MKKLARFLGVLGGVAAVVWAMRERFVSIAAPREPEPPTFRVVTPPSQPPRPQDPDDLTAVNGIGPVFARRLMEGGISTFSDLATAETARVIELTGVTDQKAADWIQQASTLR